MGLLRSMVQGVKGNLMDAGGTALGAKMGFPFQSLEEQSDKGMLSTEGRFKQILERITGMKQKSELMRAGGGGMLDVGANPPVANPLLGSEGKSFARSAGGSSGMPDPRLRTSSQFGPLGQMLRSRRGGR